LQRHLTQLIPIRGVILSQLQKAGLYTRPLEWRSITPLKQIMWDVISDAAMSTQHANARFLVPHLAKTGWALFTDGDMLYRSNVARLFEEFDTRKAVYCVKHEFAPVTEMKMDGQIQTIYPRKNWTSFIAFNCDHEVNRALTVELINSLPGRDLHRLCWIKDDDLIGDINREWNWLVGHSDPTINPKSVHFTEGVPDMPGYESVPYADEWRTELEMWAGAGR
jgi:hypothetical protein